MRITNDNYRVKLAARYKGRIYHFSSLEFKADSRELMYIFHYLPKRNVCVFKDFITGQKQETLVLPFDHITFHKDGKVHMVYKNKKNKGCYMNEVRLPTNIFDLNPNCYATLLIHTVYINEEHDVYPLLGVVGENTFMWDIQDSDCFSLLPIVIGKDVNYKLTITKYPFREVISEAESKYFYEPFVYHPPDGDYSHLVPRDISILLAFTRKTMVSNRQNSASSKMLEIAPNQFCSGISILPTETRVANLA